MEARRRKLLRAFLFLGVPQAYAWAGLFAARGFPLVRKADRFAAATIPNADPSTYTFQRRLVQDGFSVLQNE